jgi:hypothetical protein
VQVVQPETILRWFEADEALDCRGRARGVHVRV